MTNSAVIEFASKFFSASNSFVNENLKSNSISLGDKNVRLLTNQNDHISHLISSAFLKVESKNSDFILEVWRTSSKQHLPDLIWAKKYLNQNHQLPFSLTAPYRIAFDKSQGFIYLYDTQSKKASVWIADDSKISLNSFVTPFRMIFSWMAGDFGGEIIHASAISHEGIGLIINGESGSGKSTLAILCALRGYEIIADDVVLYHNGTISAVYKYAKIDSNNSSLNLSHLQKFKMEKSPYSKDILDLNQFEGKFVVNSNASAILLPIFAHLNHYSLISPGIAIKLLAPNSLRELMGGTPQNFKNLVNLSRKLPCYRLALSSDNEKNLKSIKSIFSELT